MPETMYRFLPAEVVARWPLDPERVVGLDGTRHQLVALLCDNFDFSLRRAGIEVDEFLGAFHDKMRRATQVSQESSCPTGFEGVQAAAA